MHSERQQTTAKTFSSSTLMALGRVFFALPMVALGAVHLFHADFVTRLAPASPTWAWGRSASACVVGALLIGGGLSVALSKWTRMAALLLATVIGISLMLLHVPKIAANPTFGGSWTDPTKYLALCGGAILIASLYPRRDRAIGQAASPKGPVEKLRPVARIFLGIFLMLCGVQHFVYTKFVATFVPTWIPGRTFWARFAGGALIAGGMGLWIPRTSRLAALLSGAMIFVWFLIVHIPRAVSQPQDMMEWSGVFESLAVSGVAFLVAATSRAATWRERDQ
jgi:uncharacterized membrane protein